MPSALRMALDVLTAPERHRYGPHAQHRCELWLPPGPGPHRAVMVIHGGFWRARYGKAVMKPVCADLVRRGLAAWNIEYRRIGRGQGGGWPATFDDVAAAIDHLPVAADGRLDPAGISLLGHSAGGQLALWAASRRNAAVKLRRVVAQAAVCDLSATRAAYEFMGGSPEQVPGRYAVADPMLLVPLGLPIGLVHGPADATVPVRHSREFAAAARATGDEVELVESPGGHRAHIDPRTPAWAAAAELLTRE
jgi:acetyl esterase/lipase